MDDCMGKIGKVWILGAGPGDAGLLTVKGRQVLEEAESVVYDALVGDGILGWLPENAEQIYVGKRGGNHAKSQAEINEILVAEAGRGKRVVRLKGGDPFVFGRGSEEAEYLNKNHIPFEVVPGVTSAVAVPAYCGIPVTHRGTAASFHVITGHLKNGEPAELDYEALCRVGGTLIFLMGVSSAKTICAGLMNAGMRGDTPAALLREGTTANQKKVVSVLANLVADAKKAGLRAPAIIIIGDVCALEDTCRWAEEKPLFGKKILVTGPGSSSVRMTDKLRREGAEVVELPAIATKLLSDDTHLKQTLGRIGDFNWLAFTSPSGAELFFQYLRQQKLDIRILSDIKIAVIGKSTGDKLEGHGLYADYMPKRYYAADLGAGLAKELKAHERLLILRAVEGSGELLAPLEKKQISYEDVALYETVYPAKSRQTLRVKKLLEDGEFDFVTFTSGSAVAGFMNALQPQPEVLAGLTAVCIGEQTAVKADALGMKYIVSDIPAVDSMVEAITSFSSVKQFFDIL